MRIPAPPSILMGTPKKKQVASVANIRRSEFRPEWFRTGSFESTNVDAKLWCGTVRKRGNEEYKK
jgi:hypothetical protein